MLAVNNYEYAFVDLSYVLTRNLWMVTKDKSTGDMNPGDVLRLMIQSVRKWARDYNIRPAKIIFIADEWSKEFGGYFTTYLLRQAGGDYKGSRKFVTEKVLEDLRSDPNTTSEELEKAEREYAVNKVKFAAKKIMKEEFSNLGIYYYSYPSWEYDQIASLAAFQRFKEGKKDVIITKDTDLMYSLTPLVDFFSIPKRGEEPKVITYDEMYSQIPEVLKNKGVSLYQYNAYLNALGKSHNDMSKSLRAGVDTTEAILHILDGDYSDLIDLDIFFAQMKSYDLSQYPGLSEVQRAIAEDFGTKGRLATLEDFHKFCERNNVTGISDKYFSDLINSFDPRLFS